MGRFRKIGRGVAVPTDPCLAVLRMAHFADEYQLAASDPFCYDPDPKVDAVVRATLRREAGRFWSWVIERGLVVG